MKILCGSAAGANANDGTVSCLDIEGRVKLELALESDVPSVSASHRDALALTNRSGSLLSS